MALEYLNKVLINHFNGKYCLSKGISNEDIVGYLKGHKMVNIQMKFLLHAKMSSWYYTIISSSELQAHSDLWLESQANHVLRYGDYFHGFRAFRKMLNHPHVMFIYLAKGWNAGCK